MPAQQRPFSPQQPYQPSPGAMSPTSLPPAAKRQRLSPQPQPMSPYSSQYNSPFSNSNPQYSAHTSPYAASPPGTQYLSLPQSPAASQPATPSFHQPQPYQPPHMAGDSRPPFSGAMLPPKVPASKAQKEDELEKSTAKDSNPNTLADVITGSGIDLQREEEELLRGNYQSQSSASTMSPHGSFNWSQQSNHGAFQGAGPLSQPKTKEEQEDELRRKHANVARIHNEAASHPLTDPFLLAAGVRQRMSKKVYEHGIKLDLEGLFDKIPSAVQNVTRKELGPSSNGESIVELQATSLLNNGAPLVDLVSLVSLAAEERVRTVIEDAFALAQGRRNTSQGVVPPSLADVAAASGDTQRTEAVVPNISKTAWEATENASSPSARLPTPPGDVSPAPQATIQFTANPIVDSLKRRMQDDEKFEKARIAKRQKRLQGNSASQDTLIATPTSFPDKPITKKERDRINKAGNTEEAVHKRANETAAMALGMKKGKKKYSWMDLGSGGGSGASTPRGNPVTVGSASGTSTPAAAQTDRGLLATKRKFQGGNLEKGDEGEKIQLRDIVHVLELDGKERKALVQIIARMRSSDTDAKKMEDRPRATPVPTAR
ncbi:uncharacterized protein CC84DRAFT_1188391 [Paraphaeosphaeria sporulosa]|uniref:Transcription initiation factor TFIID subunit 4 n=1 Tax=Paraphaeosphaeria sporulosa TaxID=1460663 RepID=A0A177C9M3_9PLEO|nr:uncharacterized protein CC84DRAFT_1188391 [Paraphaeosphaeria sporulosa]OAG03821.1 hypothetical protein CC84DRAFT_1188391 [Paraphaeosphaeria sporulosa]